MTVLAVTGQQAVGFAIAALVILGWVVFGLVNLRRSSKPGSEIELAANRKPYLDDDQLEGPKLDRVLSWGLITMAFTAVALPLYWLREPGRQAGAEQGFDKRAIERGKEMFEEFCSTCHGAGTEGEVDYSLLTNPDDPSSVQQVKWHVPALNTEALRFAKDEIHEVIEYGRKGTPMPPWGVDGGGPMNKQQIDNIVAYLTSEEFVLDSEEVTKQNEKDFGTDGQRLFEAFCARCHTKGWSYKETYPEPDAVPGGGAFGPNLTNGATIRQFLTAALQEEFITTGSEDHEQYGLRGIGTGRMPGFGKMLSKEQIKAIVAYERSL